MNRRNLIKNGVFGLAGVITANLGAEEYNELNEALKLFKKHGYHVTKNHMFRPVWLYDIVKRDCVASSDMNMVSGHSTVVAIEAGSLRYSTLDDLERILFTNKHMAHKTIFVPYTIVEYYDKAIHSHYKAIRGAWLDHDWLIHKI
jgi:hypothetical protein